MANIHQGVDSRWFGGNEFLRLNWQLQANCRQLVAVVVLLHVGAHLGWGFCASVEFFPERVSSGWRTQGKQQRPH